MTGRHRARRPSTRKPSTRKPSTRKPSTRKPSTRKLGAAAIGALSVGAAVLPMAPAIAAAEPLAPHGPHVHPPGQHDTRGGRVVHTASEQWGRPYMYGAEGPVAFDCSGLTKYVYKQFGVRLPHNSALQYQVVAHVSKSDMRLGDLVFFYDDSGIYHVGIYAGGDQMWAAGSTGDYVRRQEIYTDHYVVGRP